MLQKGIRTNARGFGVEAALIAVARVATRGMGFVTSILIARILGVEGRGLIAALSVPTSLAVNFSEMGIRQATAFFIGKGTLVAEQVVPTLMTMMFVSSLIGAILSIAYFEIAGVAQGNWLVRGLAVAVILPSLVVSYCSGVFLGRNRIGDFRKTSWRPPLVKLVTIAVAGWALGLGLVGVLAGTLFGAMLGAGYALWLLHRNVPLRLGYDRTVAFMLHAKGLSYAVSLLALMVNYRIMTLLLTIKGDLIEVGLYAQAVLIAELLWEVPNSLSALLLSRAVNARESDDFSLKVMSLARVSVLLAGIGSAFVAIASPWFFPLVFGSGFDRSAPLCVALLPGVVAFTMFKILNMDIAGRGRPWITLIVMLPVLLINVVVGWYAVEFYGAMGAALTSSACFVLATIAYIFVYARVVGVSPLAVVKPSRLDIALVGRALAPLNPFRYVSRKGR